MKQPSKAAAPKKMSGGKKVGSTPGFARSRSASAEQQNKAHDISNKVRNGAFKTSARGPDYTPEGKTPGYRRAATAGKEQYKAGTAVADKMFTQALMGRTYEPGIRKEEYVDKPAPRPAPSKTGVGTGSYSAKLARAKGDKTRR